MNGNFFSRMMRTETLGDEEEYALYQADLKIANRDFVAIRDPQAIWGKEPRGMF